MAFAEWLDAIIEIMAELTKETIMMTANGLFSKDGVREVSIDDICRKLCISKKTFYQYYAQKEDLVADVVPTMSRGRRMSSRGWSKARTPFRCLRPCSPS